MNEEKVLAILNRVFRIDEEMEEINNQRNKVKRDYDNKFAEQIRKYSREPEKPNRVRPSYNGPIWVKRKNSEKQAELIYKQNLEKYEKDKQDYERRKKEDPVHAFPPELRGLDNKYMDWFKAQDNRLKLLANERECLLEQSGIASDFLKKEDLYFIRKLLIEGQVFPNIYNIIRNQRQYDKMHAEIDKLRRENAELKRQNAEREQDRNRDRQWAAFQNAQMNDELNKLISLEWRNSFK